MSSNLTRITTAALPLVLFLLASLQNPFINACILCPLHIPARPKPLDQFRLPSISKIMETADSIHSLCGNGSDSKVNSLKDTCRSEISHLACSLGALIENLKSECPGSEDVESCSRCRRESAETYNRNSWILTWIDSIGKMPSGISDGNYHWLGDYEQCQKLKNDQSFNGQYCLLQFKVLDSVLTSTDQCDQSDPLEVHLGICLPANCSDAETKRVAEYVANHPIDVHCQPPKLWPLSSKFFLALTLLWVLAVMIVSAMIWLLDGRSEQTLGPSLLALSLQRNIRAALRTTRLVPRDYHAIQGLQVLSTILFVFGNLFFLIMPYLENVAYFYALADSPFAQPVVNYTFYVDGLFALGALKLALKSSSEFETVGKVLGAIKRRLLRNYVPYLFITAIMALLYVRLGEGPMWSHSDISLRCADSWLVNILLLNNIFGHSKTCLDAGFVMALEAQFFLVVMFALWFSGRWRRATVAAICLTISTSLLFTSVFAYARQTPPTLIPTVLANTGTGDTSYSALIDVIYLNPLARAVPFLLGLLVPLQFGRHSFLRKPNPSQPLAPLLFLVCLLVVAFLIWTPYLLSSTTSTTPITRIAMRVLSAAYCAAHRGIWAAVLLYAAVSLNKSRNSLNAFLSWRVFHPLSKLVYTVLLVSEPVSLSLFSSLHRPIYATPLSTMLTCVGTVTCSFLIAFAIDVVLTRPIRQLMSLR